MAVTHAQVVDAQSRLRVLCRRSWRWFREKRARELGDFRVVLPHRVAHADRRRTPRGIAEPANENTQPIKGSLKQIRRGIDLGAVVGLGFSIYPQIYP
jgi:hypothetical protein